MQAPAPRRRQRDAEATRDAIIAAALDEFAQKGFFGARVEEIAARTHTSKHMIYYYFSSKEGLYAAVLERAYGDFRASEGGVDYDALDPVAALTALVGATFDTHQRNPLTIRILISENLGEGRHVRTIDHTAQRELVIATTGRILARGVEQGVFLPGVDPLQLHMTLSALCFYYVSNRYTFGAIFDVDLTSDAAVALRRAEVIRVVLARCLVGGLGQ